MRAASTSPVFVGGSFDAWRRKRSKSSSGRLSMSSTIKRAVGYYRYSSEAQRDSTSIDVQREQCERSAGGSLPAYMDEAKTGRALAGRENLHRLMADAAEGKIARVYVYRFD